MELKACSFKTALGELRTLELLLEKRQSKQPMNIQCENSNLKSAWDTHWGGYLLILECPRETEFMEGSLKEQRNWQA